MDEKSVLLTPEYEPAWLEVAPVEGRSQDFAVRGQEFAELSNSGGVGGGGARVYRVAPSKVLAFGDEHGQTAYRF